MSQSKPHGHFPFFAPRHSVDHTIAWNAPSLADGLGSSRLRQPIVQLPSQRIEIAAPGTGTV